MANKTKLLGLLVNPIAGMGGAVGLKGTDGCVEEAKDRGAVAVAPGRARVAIRALKQSGIPTPVLTASDQMGEDYLAEAGIPFKVVYQAKDRTDFVDTKKAVEAFLASDVALIMFCGGDGTARDVASVANDTPILGIPAGVKMHSGVFAVGPVAAASLAAKYLNGDLRTRETEIVDVDEELYRAGELSTKLYATGHTPYAPALVQERKQVYSYPDEEEFKREIAQFSSEFMRDGSTYIVGAGTTTEGIAKVMGLDKTLLGVDVIRGGLMVMKDASNSDLKGLLSTIEPGTTRIIVSPIGAQGFIFGRGSQQISPDIIRLVGIQNIIVVATPHKLKEIHCLLVDTGDSSLDADLSGERQVVCGYRLAILKEVKAADIQLIEDERIDDNQT